MALKNMRLSPKEAEAEEDRAEVSNDDAPAYPYGLCINLDSESLAKLGISEPPAVGTKMALQAIVEVVSMSQYQNQKTTDSSVSLQITDMDLQGKSDAAEKLYGGK